MAALSQQESRKRYSWWLDSHISPKNSKWLQENLTGMDSKVKQMIKLIEEDADSFARRAEMLYKRRPELMRLVEEFYRAYRGLAERYDHATGVIRHAHKTMVAAFPEQDLMSDDLGEFSDPGEMEKDALGLSSHDTQVPKRKGLKQIDFFEKGMARKSLNFNETREKERNLNQGRNHNATNVSFNDSEHSLSMHDVDISLMKEALVKLEAEKEAGLLNYQISSERLSKLDEEFRLAQEDSDKLTARARAVKAEGDVELLNGALIELKAEKELVHLQFRQCLNKISILEEQIYCFEQDAKETSDRAKKAESEVQLLKQDLALLLADKEAIAVQHKQCMETLTDVQTKLQQAEESVKRTNERAKVAESKVETLNLNIIRLTEEKNAYSVQCQQYLERISSLEFHILHSQDKNQRMNEEMSNGLLKLKVQEDQCRSIATSHQSLQSDLDSLIWKMESKNKELAEKQIELNMLWTYVQAERSRFVEAVTAFQTLQHLHNESQQELTILGSELQKKAQTVLDLEEHNNSLQHEVVKIKEENRTLNEINFSSSVSMENMEDEISSLRDSIVKLHEEIEVRVTERNILQQEIYTLREEVNELKLKHGTLIDQMELLELDPKSFGSSVTELQDNIYQLNDAYQTEKNEKVALLEKLEIMAQLVEKNALLEISIADLNAELQQVKDRVKTLEETCHILVKERSAIVAEKNALHSQIQILTKNSGALLVNNFSLENSLADANSELDALTEKTTRLEDSLLLIGVEKTRLLNKTETLSSQLRVKKHRLAETEVKCEKLEVEIFDLETEKQFLISSISETCDSLNSSKKKNSNTVKFYQSRLASLERQLHLLQEEAQLSKNMYNEELGTTVRAAIEISILHSFLDALHENNTSLGRQCVELIEASQTSEKVISDLDQKYANQQAVSKMLFEELEKLEVKNFDLETEKQFLICSISEMCYSLNSAKKENSDTVKFYKTQQASSDCQLHQLREEAQLSKNMYNEELDTTVRAAIEISIFYSFLQELQGNYTSLGRKCLKLFKAFQISEKLISDLEQQYADQQAESKTLFKVLEKLRGGFYQMSKTLNFEKGITPRHMCEDITFSDQLHSNQILETAEEIKKALTTIMNENETRTVKYDDLCSSKHSLETELLELIKEHENVKTRGLLYEREYEKLLKEQQVSAILEACYHEKFQELSKKFKRTVSTVSSIDSEAQLLKERLTVLEVENAGLKAHFREYNSAVKSLPDSVACLESQAINVTKEARVKQYLLQEDTSNGIMASGCLEIKNLRNRIQAVELAVNDIQKTASEECLGSTFGSQRLVVPKEDLVTGRSFRKERVEARRQRLHNSGTSSELSELPKDIMLYQVSDCSSYGQSGREISAADNLMLESWGTTNKASSLDFSNAKAQKPSHGNETSSSEITTEKEMSVVDKLEIPKITKDRQQTGKKVKILERLHFDAQKLANLQRTVHDLKSKVRISEKSKRTKDVIEYDTVKEQLEEAEETIEKLFGVNEKLTRTVEDDSLSSKSGNGSDESDTVRRRRVLEQIRRASEKISLLHFEVQKLQLEGEINLTVKTNVIPRSPRVRLREYLYGNSRQTFAHKQKRRQFFWLCSAFNQRRLR